ncbi:MAG: hypothetical protein ABJE95_16255 [Byssovorax sp.]
MRTSIALLATALPLVLIACTGATPPPQTSTAEACAGPVATPPPGLVKADEAPPGWSIGAPGKGSLCAGQVFVAQGPVTVYRVFSASYQTSKLAGPAGAFWTLDKPSGTAANYRNVYEICKEWNDLDMLNECTIEVGAKVVLGPGQSATCDKSATSYPRSAANQIVLVKKADGSVPVVDCKESAQEWTP